MERSATERRAPGCRSGARAVLLGLVVLLALSRAVLASESAPLPLEPSPAGEPGRPEEEELGWSRSGSYLGIGGTFALALFDIPGRQHDSGSLVFRAGYRGYPWLAVELLGEVLPGFEGEGGADDVSGFEVTANARLVLPIGRVEPWTMLGVGILDIDRDGRSREDDFAFRGAVGMDLHLTPRWSLYGEAALLVPAGDVERFDYATFGGGLLFRF